MRAWAAILGLWLLVGVATAPAPARAEPDLGERLDALLAPHFAADQPGAAVLVRKGAHVLLRKGYGRADLDKATAVRPEMVFRLGSVTKQFTAVAIMILVDAAKLSLRDDLRKWVPEYPDHGAAITIEHLLTHTSGIPSFTDQPQFFQQLSTKDLSHAEVLATFKDLPLDFPPGRRWKYSNSGYYLLGMIVEKASGQSYAQFVADRIFKPLGMTHTRTGDSAPVLPGGVRGYQRTPSSVRKAAAVSMKSPFAAGGLISSVDDLALWDRAIADGTLLSKASWQRVFTPMTLEGGAATDYGFGWKLTTYEGHRVQSHGGGISGFNTAILRMPDDQLLVVVLCNSIPAPVHLDELALQLAALAIDKPIVEPKVTRIDPGLLDRYAGVYSAGTTGTHTLVVRRNGDHLNILIDDHPSLEAFPTSDSTFTVEGTSLERFSFSRDGKTGVVTGVDVVQRDGQQWHRTRTDKPLPPEKTGIAVDPAVLERYVGEYELNPGFVVAIEREGSHLFTRATNQPRFELLATSPTEFSLRGVDARVTFYTVGNAPADHLVVHQNGRDVPGKRLR